MAHEDHWKVKLAAWLHDPAEKALVLLRGVPHDKVTVDKVLTVCFPDGVKEDWKRIVEVADHWASGADRPTMPLPHGQRYPEWLAVKFWESDQAEIIHPISGNRYQLRDLYQDSLPNIERLSLESYLDLIAPDTGGERRTGDSPRKVFLTLWRLLPELDPLKLGHLWRLLPADTRVPAHTIWDHLSLTSALAGAMAADPKGTPALLAVSLGPVQSFIERARNTSDLWAGSHLLSYLCWKAMEVICADFGPDSILFPRLWGVPLVDMWLEEQGVPFHSVTAERVWKESASDSNPLFVAALPNRFVAVLPSEGVKDLTERLTCKVREEAHDLALKAAMKLAGEENLPQVLKEQISGQLQDFPELHWAAVSFRSLLQWDERGVIPPGGEEELEKILGDFFPSEPGGRPGFLGTHQWSLLSKPIGHEHDVFVYRPNPGVLYPALYQLLDKVHAATKATRHFKQLPQEGFRCSLCGELEWLTDKREHLGVTPGKRKGMETIWNKVAREKPFWAREGEHLCALCALKRAWPDLFSGFIEDRLGLGVDRFVVSTHTMALAADLQDILADKEGVARLQDFAEKWTRDLEKNPRVAMPLKLHRELTRKGDPKGWTDKLRRLPALLDSLKEGEASEDSRESQKSLRRREELEKGLEKVFGNRPETYYAVLLMDGDHMGAWVSGTPPSHMIKHEELFHSRVREGLLELAERSEAVRKYLSSERSPSPSYHASISSALNSFSLYVVLHVLENLYLGKTIYAGGDDVLALVSVDDCLEAALTLRCAFSGVTPGHDREAVWALLGWLEEQRQGLRDAMAKGFVMVRNRLLHMMGEHATASGGLVIAHHTTPLQMVLRQARRAEQMAKQEGRDRLGIILLKRAGGASEITVPFGMQVTDSPGRIEAQVGRTPLGALLWLRDVLAIEGMSRRAAYHVQEWLRPLAGSSTLEIQDLENLLAKNIAWQLARQWSGPGSLKDEISELASALAHVSVTVSGRGKDPANFLSSMFSVAEFLARQGRARRSGKLEKIQKGEVTDGLASG